MSLLTLSCLVAIVWFVVAFLSLRRRRRGLATVATVVGAASLAWTASLPHVARLPGPDHSAEPAASAPPSKDSVVTAASSEVLDLAVRAYGEVTGGTLPPDPDLSIGPGGGLNLLNGLSQEEKDQILGAFLVLGAGSARLPLLAMAAEEAGEAAPAPPCRNCAYAGWARVHYAHPDVMRYETPSEVGLALQPSELDLDPTALLDPRRYGGALDTLSEPVPYSLTMRATVTAPEIDFKVEPAGWQIRDVGDLTEPMTWSWFVTPLRPGAGKRLTIRFQAVLVENGEERAFGSREEVIEVSVDVTPWGRLTYMAGEVTAVHAALAGVGGTGVGVLAWMLGWFRKPKPKEPLELEIRFPTDPGDGDKGPGSG